MAAIISNSSKFSIKDHQLNANSWKPGSEYTVTLGYCIILGRSGDCDS